MLEVKQVSFAWSDDLILEDVSFNVEPGKPVAITGANGSGKTTLLRVLAGLAMPVEGSVYADGADIFKNSFRYRRILGYLSESAPVNPKMTVSKYLRFRAKLKGEQSKKISHRVEEAMEICRLSAYADSRIGLLSRGQMKRVALADVFLLRPRYVILDDPYAGLDDISREALCNVIRNVSSFASVIAAGHEVEEFSKWASVKYEMRAGQLSDLSENEKPKGVEM